VIFFNPQGLDMKQLRTAMTALLAASLNFACSASEPPSAERLFTQRCAACHTVQKLMPDLKKEPLPQRETNLRKFLERHHAPSAADRDVIVAYLIKESSK